MTRRRNKGCGWAAIPVLALLQFNACLSEDECVLEKGGCASAHFKCCGCWDADEVRCLDTPNEEECLAHETFHPCEDGGETEAGRSVYSCGMGHFWFVAGPAINEQPVRPSSTLRSILPRLGWTPDAIALR